MTEAKRELFSEEAVERVLSLKGYLKVVRPNASHYSAKAATLGSDNRACASQTGSLLS
jgi:capsular polysaccharide biosynthesis protein